MVVKQYCSGCGIKVNPGAMFGLGCNCIEFEDGFYCDTCAAEMVKYRREKLAKSNPHKEDKTQFGKREY